MVLTSISCETFPLFACSYRLLLADFLFHMEMRTMRSGVMALVVNVMSDSLTRNPCDISVHPWGGAEIRDSREGFGVGRECQSWSMKNGNLVCGGLAFF